MADEQAPSTSLPPRRQQMPRPQAPGAADAASADSQILERACHHLRLRDCAELSSLRERGATGAG